MSRILFLCIVYGLVLGCRGMAISTYSPDTPGMFIPRPSSGVTNAEPSTINTNRKKKTTMMVSSLLKYLRKFKYLDPSPCPSCEQDSSIISEALSTLQQWAHINNTGILDSDTVEVMSKRRCGVPDEPKQFSVSNNKNKRHKRSFFWHIYHGSRWYKNDLTYIINMPHKFPNKRAVEKIIRAALHAWESVTQLTFRQKRYGSADIEVNFLTGRHGDGSPFDGNGGILAHAFFPYDNSPGLSGDAHFDADEDWGSEMDLNTTADLYCVAVHEFGHSLGLMHSRWPISIMWPWMKGDCTLSKFDIAVIQKIYGAASERKWKRPRPTILPPQTTHVFVKPNAPTMTTSMPFISSSQTTPEHTTMVNTTFTETIQTTTNTETIATAIQTKLEDVYTDTTVPYRSSVMEDISTTVTQAETSSERPESTWPITTNLMTDPNLSQQEGLQTWETETLKSQLTSENSWTSPSTIFYMNTLPDSPSARSSALFKTMPSLDSITHTGKSSGIPLSDRNVFASENPPIEQSNLLGRFVSTQNGLSLEVVPSSTLSEKEPPKIPLSDQNGFSTENQPKEQIDLFNKLHSTRNGLPVESPTSSTAYEKKSSKVPLYDRNGISSGNQPTVKNNPQRSTQNGLYLQAMPSSTVYEKEYSKILLLDQIISSFENISADKNDSLDRTYSTENSLFFQTQSSSPKVRTVKNSSSDQQNSLLENTVSNIDDLKLINSLSTIINLSSRHQRLYPKNSSSKPQSLGLSNLTPVRRTMFTQTLPSQRDNLIANTPSSKTNLPFIYLYSFPTSTDSTSQSKRLHQNSLSSKSQSFEASNQTLISSSPFQVSSSSQMTPSKTNLLSEEHGVPFLNALPISTISSFNPKSLPPADPFYRFNNHRPDLYYENKIAQIDISKLYHLSKPLSSTLGENLKYYASKGPFELENSSLLGNPDYHRTDSSENYGLNRNISKLPISKRSEPKHSDLFAAKSDQLTEEFSSMISQSKPAANNFQATSPSLETLYPTEIPGPLFNDRSSFGMHWLPDKNLLSPHTQLYKTATVSMTTKPAVLLKMFKWMPTTSSQALMDSEQTVIGKTSPEGNARFHQKKIAYDIGPQTSSYLDASPVAKSFPLYYIVRKARGQGEAFQGITTRQNEEVFRLGSKLEQNGMKNNRNIKIKEFKPQVIISERPFTLKEPTNGKLYRNIIPSFYGNTINKLEATTSRNNKNQQLSKVPTLEKTTSANSQIPLLSSEAVLGFVKALRQQNQEREVFLPYSLQESLLSTPFNGRSTRDVPLVDLNTPTLSPSSTTLFAGGADARRNRLYHVVSGKRRVKMWKPRYRKKIGMQQFVQSLRFIPPHGSQLRDTKLDRLTTLPSQNMDATMKTLLTPPTNNTPSHTSTSSLKADPYLIFREISHRFLSPPTSHTTQKWIGDTQRSNLQAQESAKNYLRESLHILSPNQQTTPMVLTMQDPPRERPKFRDQGYNDGNYNIQQTEISLDQESLQTISETMFHRVVTPDQQRMMPLSNYAKKSKNNPEEVGSSSRIHKRSLQEDVSDLNTLIRESPTSDYSHTTTILPSLILKSTLRGPPVDLLNNLTVGRNPMKNFPERYIRHSDTDQMTATATTIKEPVTMQPWCSGSITVDGATVDKNGTINIFKGSNVMRFPFCAKCDGRRQRTFVSIFKIFPNGPINISAAVSISLGRKKTWERTYLFQGRLVWRYRQCRRGYCLDRGYPTNTHQEFNVSIPIKVTAAYMNNRKRTLFLFNGTSFYHSVRCLRWLRKNGCSSTETEMRPGLLSSLRGIDATFTHQGIFYVIHGGGFFTTMLRSMKANAFQYGSIAENWYGCPAKNIFNQTFGT